MGLWWSSPSSPKRGLTLYVEPAPMKRLVETTVQMAVTQTEESPSPVAPTSAFTSASTSAFTAVIASKKEEFQEPTEESHQPAEESHQPTMSFQDPDQTLIASTAAIAALPTFIPLASKRRKQKKN